MGRECSTLGRTAYKVLEELRNNLKERYLGVDGGTRTDEGGGAGSHLAQERGQR
jgi:hypothetical protein